MTAEKVDPAALLIAVLAVGIGPLTEDGPWAPMNTIIGIATLLIILPYAFTKGPRKHLIDAGPRLPVCVAVGLVVGVTCAWPNQNQVAGRPLFSRSIVGISEQQADAASYRSLALAALVCLGLWILLSAPSLREKMVRRDTNTQDSAKSARETAVELVAAGVRSCATGQ